MVVFWSKMYLKYSFYRCIICNKNYSGMWTTAVKLVREQPKLQSCLQTFNQVTKPNLVSTKPNHCTTPRLFVSRLLTPLQFHQWRMSKDKFMKPNQINPKILYFWTTYIPIFLSYREKIQIVQTYFLAFIK